MKAEIPPRIISAPIAIAITPPPLSPLPPAVDVVGVTGSAGVLAVVLEVVWP
jgi:hypothetical protein